MDCFGDSSSEDEEECLSSERDASCGVFSFHPNTEASMLVHVRNALDVPDPSADGRHAAAIEDQARGLRTDIDAKLKRSKRLLEAVDEFCYSRHWMMHVGPSKGEILTRSLVEAVNRKLDGKIVCKSNAPTQFVVLELGAYCGYSSILMARAMLETMKQSDALNGHVFTTEINPESVRVSESLVRMSGLEDLISVNQIYFNGVETNVIEVAREAMHLYETNEIDFLFIDHDKDSYLPDLKRFEKAGLISNGTRVVADNVVFAQISDYLQYVQQRQRDGVVTTHTVVCSVEYSSTEQDTDQEYSFRDGVEITDFL